ncbi:uncharacterized protein [Diadema antillarum]|uniref:uncharacterized protein n=1 Tax=Diadema antillarum TaxID=105358 RepID=UPI003A83BE54
MVVFERDRYVCFEGFNAGAAELICGELGFPEVEEYSVQTLPRTVPQSRTRRLSCLDVPGRFQRLKDCSLTADNCSSNEAVRLQCREPYGEIGSDSQAWTCPSQAAHESDQEIHYLFNVPVGFCVYPGHVRNGHWDSNMTTFGSKITLNCDEGYSINGSATLQCVGLPGRSTYFPIWNMPIPFCWKFENVTKGGAISTTPTQNTDYISSEEHLKYLQGEGLTTQELTQVPETTATSFLRDGKPTEVAVVLPATNNTTPIADREGFRNKALL